MIHVDYQERKHIYTQESISYVDKPLWTSQFILAHVQGGNKEA